MADQDGDTVGTIDIEDLSDKIGAGLFGEQSDDETTPEVEEPEVPSGNLPKADAPATTPAAPSEKTPPVSSVGPSMGATVTPAVETPYVKAVPKSWPKEMHEHWGKIDPKVQEYWEKREHQMLEGLEQYKGDAQFGKTFRDVLIPYVPHLRAQGVDPVQMIGNLMNAQWRLTQGTLESRKATYEQLGRNLGFVQADPTAEPANPNIQRLEQQLKEIQSGLTAREEAALGEARTRASQEVESFASDTTKHPYFDEVADDIVRFIQQGLDLNTAYTKAVRANDATWTKEVARIQTEHEAKLKENARLEGLPKKAARSINVKSRDTERAPTEPLGTMEDTIREALRARKERTH